MNAAVHPSDALLPQRPGGLGTGAVLALLVHAGLIAALAFGVNWRAQAPDTVSAELWSALPQVAAPRLEETAPTPPPPSPEPAPAPPPKPVAEPRPPPVEKAASPPPDPDIALRREKLEREKEAREKLERAQAEKARAERERNEKEQKERTARLEKDRLAKAEQARLDKAAREKADRERDLREKEQREKAAELKLAQQREENLKRMMGQIGATGSPSSTGTAAQDSGPSKTYAGRLVAHIKPNIVFTETVAGNPAAEVEVRAGPSGSIVSRRLVKSSGNKDWDEAVLRAIDRTGTLPRDVDGRVPSTILVAFRPQE